jgi:DNA-directed RNA polymerase sigma subunit (sigma70/sigma32)
MNKKEQELKLWKNWKQYDDTQSRDKLLISLEPLLYKEVNKYTASPLPRTTIETEARILALNAFQSYDPTKAQLNTHVTNHLKHLQRYVLTYQNVGKIPEHRGIAISKYQNIRDNMSEDLGREPTSVELADALQWSPAEVERMQIELRRDLSIAAKKEDEDAGGFFDYTFSTTDPLKEAIQFVYFDSSAEDKKILEYTFAIGGEKTLAPKEIAKKLHKTEGFIKLRLKVLAMEINNARL